jgi:hypothetical protein
VIYSAPGRWRERVDAHHRAISMNLGAPPILAK